MSEQKPKSRLPVIITLLLTGLVMVVGNWHCCHLHSTLLEVLLPITVISTSCFWTARAKTRGRAWFRTGLTMLIAFAIQHAYLTWLHSPKFPDVLLSKYSKEKQAKIDEISKRITQQDESTESTEGAPSAEP